MKRKKMNQPINEFQGEYRWLSNFFIGEPLRVLGMTFQTSEHMYQALKTTDPVEVKAVLSCQSPGEAKRLGKTLTLREDWDSVKDRAMELCVGHKFAANPNLTERLLATGSTYLLEGNTWHDNYWGGCQCDKCAFLDWHNKLGYTLMRYRDNASRWLNIDI
jgi:ribA/ribD-fused uncharacterized protein